MAQAVIDTIGTVSGVMGIVDFFKDLVPDDPASGTAVTIKSGYGSVLDDTSGWV